MKITKTLTILALLSVFLLTSCAGGPRNSAGPGAGIGAGIGAALGQAIGHDTEATLIGAAIGTFLGYGVGNEVDKNNSYNRQQPQTTGNYQGQPFLIKDGRSPSSKRLGMLQDGDWKTVGIPTYDQYNNLLYTEKVNLKVINGQWTLHK